MALGAQRGSVYGLILKEAGWLIAAGVALGLGLSMGAAMLMRGLLFGVRTWDAETLAGVAAVLGICALLASYFPAPERAPYEDTGFIETRDAFLPQAGEASVLFRLIAHLVLGPRRIRPVIMTGLREPRNSHATLVPFIQLPQVGAEMVGLQHTDYHREFTLRGDASHLVRCVPLA